MARLVQSNSPYVRQFTLFHHTVPLSESYCRVYRDLGRSICIFANRYQVRVNQPIALHTMPKYSCAKCITFASLCHNVDTLSSPSATKDHTCQQSHQSVWRIPQQDPAPTSKRSSSSAHFFAAVMTTTADPIVAPWASSPMRDTIMYENRVAPRPAETPAHASRILVFSCLANRDPSSLSAFCGCAQATLNFCFLLERSFACCSRCPWCLARCLGLNALTWPAL